MISTGHSPGGDSTNLLLRTFVQYPSRLSLFLSWTVPMASNVLIPNFLSGW